MRTGLSLLILCSACASNGQYDGPESVEYDVAGDRYFVSNTGDGTIKQRDQAGAVTPFVSVSPAPYGLEIQGDTLFACSGGSVKGFLLSSGAMVFNLNLGGSFLNGITSDGTYLYVTDFSAGKIFRVDVAANSFTTWVASTGGTPNGIVYHEAIDQLLVAYWGTNALVRGYDRATAAIMGNVSTGLTNIDGIAVDCNDLVLIASWSPDRITRFDYGVISPIFEDLMISGLSNPADVDYDEVHHRVCIPNAGNNTVLVPGVFPCATDVLENVDLGYEEVRVFPNPVDGLVRIDVHLEQAVPYLFLNTAGLLIGGGTLPVSGLLDLSPLPTGQYIMDIPVLRKRARLVKQ